MAEDRKPKIDLKARLQKMGGPGVPTPPPSVGGGMPAPSMAPPRSGPSMAPMPSASMPPSGVSRPPGLSAGGSARPGGLDPAHPLAAVAQPFKSVPSSAQPHVIEMDEAAVRQARRGGFKGGLAAGIVVGIAFLVLGWAGGNASSQGAARSQGVRDAHDLSNDLSKARDSLVLVKTKLQEGGKTLSVDKKFPVALGQQLAGMRVDFAGDKLYGRRFSGVPAETTRNLFDFIARVQALNDKKDLIVSLLAKLQKPITEELSRSGQAFTYVVVLDKDTPTLGGFLAPLTTPVAPDGVPNELTFANPRGGGNVKLPRLLGDKIPKEGAAVTVVQNTFERVCPSATRGQIAQLASSMNSLVGDIEGQKSLEGGDVITETKAGLEETAAKISEQLAKVTR